ncbi:MAG: FAD:protein FMN transferase [Betaproteobacteria bacterium]|nr:MAG: FAD:protein FMN transferase [Betaproteobacteria bacterium]
MRRRTFITLLAAVPAAACVRPVHTTISGLTMGTRYAVQLAAPIDDGLRAELAELIELELAAINRAMSTYDPRSELSEFNRRQDLGWVPASRGLLEVLDSATRISASSEGAFDVTVGPLVDLWGFGPQYRTRRVPDDAAIEQVRNSVGYQHVQTDSSAGAIRKTLRHTQVDLSAIAKGYGVDRVAMILDRLGVDGYLVEIGGEFRARGTTAAGRPWRVAIAQPVEGRRSHGKTVGETVVLENRAIATSGTTIDFFEQDGRHYSHSIDPRTGRPVEHPPMAVSVVADTAMEADGWATALLVLGPERGYSLAQARGLAALLVTASGPEFDVRVTDGLRAHLIG